MAKSTIKRYLINPQKEFIPDKRLGEFRQGFTNRRKHFNWTIFWVLPLPIIGQIAFIWHLIWRFVPRSQFQNALLYKNGFIIQNIDRKYKKVENKVYDFRNINGMICNKDCRYEWTEFGKGIDRHYDWLYEKTYIQLSTLDACDNKVNVLSGEYDNENETEGKYNFYGYACQAIYNAWTPFAIGKFKRELAEQGYGTFVSNTGEVLVGQYFISANGRTIDSDFEYSLGEEKLILRPVSSNGPVIIDLKQMYNKEAFLWAIKHILGITSTSDSMPYKSLKGFDERVKDFLGVLLLAAYNGLFIFLYILLIQQIFE